ncbi:hypothetical protein [Echinicola vietnamensis]|uniref:Uncharacterized protein n=1 Tax=Echinicola vietnamensis (strain DSM 17526 / LMG 23754 / KMM 6221) TaxID=926556 RepID=L0G210_ECHVK|nr:hypothetical protein [Echinicola vietnamensis]AGA79358.1 hypothetical protein Echvi_3120 [Echinicola vietnamensis DSM 17526]
MNKKTTIYPTEPLLSKTSLSSPVCYLNSPEILADYKIPAIPIPDKGKKKERLKPKS